MQGKGLLIAKRSLARAFRDGVGNATRQRTDARMAKENSVARNGKFVATQFFVGQDIIQGHGN